MASTGSHSPALTKSVRRTFWLARALCTMSTAMMREAPARAAPLMAEADSATADNGYRAACFHLGGVNNRANAGGDAAAN